jgi:hypothetical protein
MDGVHVLSRDEFVRKSARTHLSPLYEQNPLYILIDPAGITENSRGIEVTCWQYNPSFMIHADQLDLKGEEKP